MNRRKFLQRSIVTGCATFFFSKFKWIRAEKESLSSSVSGNGLPACFPFCLDSPSVPLVVEVPPKYEIYLPAVSRNTSHGGMVVKMPRRRLLRFWER